LLLLPLLSRKIKRTISTLLPHPSLLAHTIYQALAFDAALIEAGFTISGTSASKGGVDEWHGVSDLILGNADWFETWVAGEKKCKSILFLLSWSLDAKIRRRSCRGSVRRYYQRAYSMAHC